MYAFADVDRPRALRGQSAVVWEHAQGPEPSRHTEPGAWVVLDALDRPLAVLSPVRELIRANAAFREQVRSDGRLGVHQGRFRLSDPVLDRRLGDAVRFVAAGRRDRDALVLAEGRDPLILWLAPAGGFCLAAPSVVRPSSPAATGPILASALGLTPAETRLCVRLAAGSSLAEAAREVGISVHTARCQLKQVFSKTRTSRQVDLLRLLSSTCPPVV